MTSLSRRAAYTMVLTPLLALAACSGNTSPAAPTQAAGPGSAASPSAASSSTSSGSGAAGSGGGAVTVSPPTDPCAVLAMDRVGMVTSGKATKSKAAPPNGCIYLDAADQVVYLYRLSTKAQLPGGIESLRNGATSRMVGTPTNISIRGFEGFQVGGKGTGTTEALIGVQVGPDYVLECNVVRQDLEVSSALGICQDATAEMLDRLAKK